MLRLSYIHNKRELFVSDRFNDEQVRCPPGRGTPAVPELSVLGCSLGGHSGFSQWLPLAALCFQGTSRSQPSCSKKKGTAWKARKDSLQKKLEGTAATRASTQGHARCIVQDMTGRIALHRRMESCIGACAVRTTGSYGVNRK